MAKKLTRRLADDIRVSLHEALDHARGKRTKAVVHRVVPRETDAREARAQLGLSQREFASFIGTGVGTVRKWELGTRRPSGAGAHAHRRHQGRTQSGAARADKNGSGSAPTGGNKLTIAFDKAGEKRVVDSFVERV